MLLNLAPDAQKHKAWTIKGELTLTLYSLARCEQLYQRYLVNQGSGYFND
jgi:hypothetical protein